MKLDIGSIDKHSALALTAKPLITTAYSSAQATGASKERIGEQAKASYTKKQKRRGNVMRNRSRETKVRRIVRTEPRKIQQHRRLVGQARPAVTMPKRVITLVSPHPVVQCEC